MAHDIGCSWREVYANMHVPPDARGAGSNMAGGREMNDECDRLDGGYEATINRNSAGGVLGCSLFLGAEDLEALGVEPTAESVEYWITPTGEVQLGERGEADD